jgi:mevalonate kinase
VLEIVDIAMAGERLVHGTPSGIDPAVIAVAAPIRFQVGAPWRVVALPPAVDILVADSGRPCDTGPMVAAVRARRDADPAGTEATLGALGALVDAGLEAIAAAEWPRLGDAMNDAHAALRSLGVSTPELDHLVAASRAAGALGAKLTGGGGGGAIVALATPDRAQAVAAALEAAGARRVYHALRAAPPDATLVDGRRA